MFTQIDSRWSSVLIGEGISIEKESCLLVCICNANKLLGNPLNPGDLAKQLLAVGGLSVKGDLMWSRLKDTSSIVWMCFDKAEVIPDMQIVEFERPCGTSHFVLRYKGETFDPKPGLILIKEKSVRYLSLIKR